MVDDEDRIALFLDYENLALGARDHLGGMSFDLKPIMDALAERGRTVVRRAYADWSYFDEDRRMLTRSQVELIEMPQRMGVARKNAADIKMAVDAVELSFVRDYVSTFVICTGDSDFTPLVLKLRELNKKVIGVGVRDSTSKLLPPACDEFLYYDNLEGVEPGKQAPRATRSSGGAGSGGGRGSGKAAAARAKAEAAGAAAAEAVPDEPESAPDEAVTPTEEAAEKPKRGSRRATAKTTAPGKAKATSDSAQEQPPEPEPEVDVEPAAEMDEGDEPSRPQDVDDIAVLVAQTISGMQSAGTQVTASALKRTLLRKDPTFSEGDHGFRAFGELLSHLQSRQVVQLAEGPAHGDPEVSLPEQGGRDDGFALLRQTVAEESAGDQQVALSGLKDRMRRHQPGFSEKKMGYRSFLQFAKAAATTGLIRLDQDAETGDYEVTLVG